MHFLETGQHIQPCSLSFKIPRIPPPSSRLEKCQGKMYIVFHVMSFYADMITLKAVIMGQGKIGPHTAQSNIFKAKVLPNKVFFLSFEICSFLT